MLNQMQIYRKAKCKVASHKCLLHVTNQLVYSNRTIKIFYLVKMAFINNIHLYITNP